MEIMGLAFLRALSMNDPIRAPRGLGSSTDSTTRSDPRAIGPGSARGRRLSCGVEHPYPPPAHAWGPRRRSVSIANTNLKTR